MKIDANKFYKFMTKATLTGTITAVIIKINKNVTTVKTMDTSTVVGVMATAKFLKTDLVENWAIKDTGLFLKMLEVFKDNGEMEVIRNENKLSFVNKDWQLEYTLADESFVEHDMTQDVGLKYKTEPITVATKVFKDIVTVINKKLTGDTGVVVKFTGTELELINGEKQSDAMTRKIAMPFGNPCKSKFGAMFSDIVKVIDEKVIINAGDNYPMTLTEDSADYTITYFIAPIVDNENEKDEEGD